MKITYLQADDWAGVYVDGKLKFEGHSIDSNEWVILLREAGVEVEDLSETDLSYETIEAHGRCPERWPVDG